MLEHNSVLRPLYHLQMNGVIDVTHIGFDSRGYIHPDDIQKSIRKNTKMVIVNHCLECHRDNSANSRNWKSV